MRQTFRGIINQNGTMKYSWLFLLILLVACNRSPQVATPTESVALLTATQTAVASPTNTNTPTLTPAPTLTPVPTNTPTATWTPAPTNTLIPTETPTTTPTPTLALPSLMGTPVVAVSQPLTVDNATEIMQLARWGKGSIKQIGWSPDGRYLAVLTQTDIYIYDNELQPVSIIPTTGLFIHFLQDNTLLTINPSGQVTQWDVLSGAQLSSFTASGLDAFYPLWLPFYPDSLAYIAVSQDDQFLVFASINHLNPSESELHIWDLAAQEAIRSFPGCLGSVYISPDNQLIAQGCMGPARVEIRHMESGELTQNWQPNSEWDFISAMSFSPDGTALTLSNQGGTRLIQTWQINPLNLRQELDRIANAPVAIRYSSDGALLATAHVTAVYLYDTASGQRIALLNTPTAGLVDIALSSDGRLLASADRNGVLRLWAMAGAETTEVAQLADFDQGIPPNLSLSADNSLLAAAYLDHLAIHEMATGNIVKSLTEGGHFGIFSPDDRHLLSAGLFISGPMIFWQTSDWTQITPLIHNLGDGRAKLSEDGSLLAVAYQQTVRLYNWDTGDLVREFQVGDGVYEFAISPDSQLLAATTPSGSLQLWDIATGNRLSTFPEAYYFGNITISPDSRYLAIHLFNSANPDNGLALFKIEDGSTFAELPSFANNVVFTPDGRLLITTNGNSLGFWEITADGVSLIHTSAEIPGPIDLILLSADGTRLITTSSDGAIRIWGIP